jgi:hypothetical protein
MFGLLYAFHEHMLDNRVGLAGHVLDCSTAWQLLGVLQAVGALPSRRQECE